MYHPPYEYYPQPQYIYGYPPPPPPQYWPPPPPPPEASVPQNAPQSHRYPSPHAIQSPHPQPSSHSSQHSHSSQPSPNVSPVAPRWQEEVQHPPPIDFAKLVDQYRLILDALSPQAPEPIVSKLVDNASLGARLLGSEAEKERERERAREREEAERKAELEREREREREIERQREEERQRELELERQENERLEKEKEKEKEEKDAAIAAAEKHISAQVCLGCNATSTPEWRRGPMGPRTLCNACGLVYAKMVKRRMRDKRANKGQSEQYMSDDSSIAEEDEEDQLEGS